MSYTRGLSIWPAKHSAGLPGMSPTTQREVVPRSSALAPVVAELVASGYLEKERDGRRNRYRVAADRPPVTLAGDWPAALSAIAAGGVQGLGTDGPEKAG